MMQRYMACCGVRPWRRQREECMVRDALYIDALDGTAERFEDDNHYVCKIHASEGRLYPAQPYNEE